MIEVTVKVTVQVDPDDGEISEHDARIAAEQAIQNALELVGGNGFSHDFADRVSIGLVGVDARA